LARLRTCPERVDVVVQISAGLFHAGYPMQGPQQACRGVTDLATLKQQGKVGLVPRSLGARTERGRPAEGGGPQALAAGCQLTLGNTTVAPTRRLTSSDSANVTPPTRGISGCHGIRGTAEHNPRHEVKAVDQSKHRDPEHELNDDKGDQILPETIPIIIIEVMVIPRVDIIRVVPAAGTLAILAHAMDAEIP
jgi:hypothetical protein